MRLPSPLKSHSMKRFGFLLVVLGLALGMTGTASAGVITAMIGSDDGFGGITGTSPGAPPGTAINDGSLTSSSALFTTPTATNETDRRSVNSLLQLNYDFTLDTTSLLSVSSAQVTIRMASVGLGSDNGFGDAQVAFNGNSLGKLRPGGLNGANPEVIQEFTFDVTPYITAGLGNQTLDFTLDGRGITGNSAGDIFTVDLARLSVEGVSAVPEPSALALLGSAAVALLGYRWRRGKGRT